MLELCQVVIDVHLLRLSIIIYLHPICVSSDTILRVLAENPDIEEFRSHWCPLQVQWCIEMKHLHQAKWRATCTTRHCGQHRSRLGEYRWLHIR